MKFLLALLSVIAVANTMNTNRWVRCNAAECANKADLAKITDTIRCFDDKRDI